MFSSIPALFEHVERFVTLCVVDWQWCDASGEEDPLSESDDVCGSVVAGSCHSVGTVDQVFI